MLELAGTIILGIFAQWIAWRIRVPAILPLIITGLLVGPISSLMTEDGTKLLQPIYNEATGEGLFPGEYLFYFVSLAIGIILFEGGLTLKRQEISGTGPIIFRLITIGPTVTFVGAGLAAHFIMALPWPIAFLFAGLIIVTGPTVIAPILQNVPLHRNVATLLKWEGILIDPIGALVAVLVFEFIRSAEGGLGFTTHALIAFGQIILIGLALGALAAFALYELIRRDFIPNYLLNVFTLAFVLGVFVFANVMAEESGLVSVVVMGMVLGNLDVPRLRDILSFKESLSVLLISILFILLAAHIELAELRLVFSDWRTGALFGFVALVLRPLSVFASTRNSGLNLREKLFISWVGPRGIVAAGIASLFGLTLTRNGVEGAEYITPLVFLIVMGTVALNAATARPMARWLGVMQKSSEGILFVGASYASRILAKYLYDNNRHVVMIDNNKSNVNRARNMGLEAFVVNIYTDDLEDHFDLLDMGYMLAMTSSADVNAYAVRRYERIFGENGTFRLITPEEMKKNQEDLPKERLISYSEDYLNLNEVARDYPEMHEIAIESSERLKTVVDQLAGRPTSIPILIKDSEGQFQIIPAELTEIEASPPFHLVYLGEKIGEEKLEATQEDAL